ncbi:hypothetical protein ACFE04_018627 [Oxalis oulophora]
MSLVHGFIFLLFIPSGSSLSFNFTTFDRNMVGITFENDSTFSSDGQLQLTINQADKSLTSSVGRASYYQRVPLWDPKSGRVTDFITHFTFVMKAVNQVNESLYGEGLTFFIAPENSTTPANSTSGLLGLVTPDSSLNSSENPFVAIEFDSLKNPWDPDDNHIGINVNSIQSVATKTWNSSIKDGKQAYSWVSYNSSTKNLSVFLTYVDNPIYGGNSSLWYIVDLKEILPEYVRVGFSASTGEVATEIHNILSWSFDSTLEITKKKNLGWVIGLIVSFGGLVCALGVVWFLCWKKRSNAKDDEEFDDPMDDEFEKGTGPKRFRYRELSQVTNNFSDAGKLGEGGFGGVYKAFGLASSLLYLHEEWEQCVVHRDIKSSNVMLDSDFNTKLGDFGLARLVDHDMGSQTTVLAGTMGYLAPECVTTGKASKESDVYSFGVVCLEIVCGRRPVEARAEPYKVRLVEWVWSLYGQGKLLEAVDNRLNMEFDERQIECLMIVGIWCCHPDYTCRPSVRQVINVMNFEAPLPSLPAHLPVPTYYAPPMSLCKLSFTSAGQTGSMTESGRLINTQCNCPNCSTTTTINTTTTTTTTTSNTTSSIFSSMSAGSEKSLLNSHRSSV